MVRRARRLIVTAGVVRDRRRRFRAIAVGFKFSWISLDVRTEGTVERSDGKMRFTKFLTHAKLRIAAGGDAEKAKRLLEKAEASCLVTNSLSSDVHLTTEVTLG